VVRLWLMCRKQVGTGYTFPELVALKHRLEPYWTQYVADTRALCWPTTAHTAAHYRQLLVFPALSGVHPFAELCKPWVDCGQDSIKDP
jgi:hypothetical protein